MANTYLTPNISTPRPKHGTALYTHNTGSSYPADYRTFQHQMIVNMFDIYGVSERNLSVFYRCDIF